MVILRNFTHDDTALLSQYFLQMTHTQIQAMMDDWNKKQHDGRYCEVLAILVEGQIVGYTSVYQHTSYTISCGPEIFAPFRRKGYAFQGLLAALEYAASLGYQIAVAQVAIENTASIALHKKLGFEIDHSFVKPKGHEVHFFIKPIGQIQQKP